MKDELDLESYVGQWVAISENKIVAQAKDAEELFKKIEKLEINKEAVSILLVPKDEETHHLL